MSHSQLEWLKKNIVKFHVVPNYNKNKQSEEKRGEEADSNLVYLILLKI